MGEVNAVASMYPTAPDEVLGVNATLDGVLLGTDGSVAKMKSAHQLCDRVIASDAIVKLRLAAANLRNTGQPFWMGYGARKPHLSFRFPAPFKQFVPALETTRTAEHPVLNADVPPIAHGDHAPGSDPYTPVSKSIAQQWRFTYYATVAWVDSQIGRVLDELDHLNLTDTTLVVLHSDHGWSLGEHGEWQKFSNFEHGTRVPLIIRAPWLARSIGQRSTVLAELIDIYPTVLDIIGIDPPKGESLDGRSLAPIFAAPSDVPAAVALKPFALSQFMRCPGDVTNTSTFWKANSCEFTDRVLFPFMGYTLRTPEWRYTEWTKWNATALAPDHTPEGLVGVELYAHADCGVNWGADYSFDAWENENVAQATPAVVAQMRALLHAVQANQTRIKSLRGVSS